MENQWKLVEFEFFCGTCKWKKEDQNGEHCDKCLTVCARENSHTPIGYVKN